MANDYSAVMKQVLAILDKNLFATMEELADTLELNRTLTYKALMALKDENKVIHLFKANYFSYYASAEKLHEALYQEPLLPQIPEKKKPEEKFGINNTEPFFKINADIGINRVIALKRVKNRLMEEYHPLFNLIISDYETLLNITGSL